MTSDEWRQLRNACIDQASVHLDDAKKNNTTEPMWNINMLLSNFFIGASKVCDTMVSHKTRDERNLP